MAHFSIRPFPNPAGKLSLHRAFQKNTP